MIYDEINTNKKFIKWYQDISTTRIQEFYSPILGPAACEQSIIWFVLTFQGLMPDLKPSLKLAEPVLEEMDYEDDEEVQSTTTEQQQQQPEDTRDVKIQRTVTQVGNEPRREKTGLRGFRPGPAQTTLYSHRRWLET